MTRQLGSSRDPASTRNAANPHTYATTADVTEEFTFEYALGQTAHVDGDERFGGAARNGV